VSELFDEEEPRQPARPAPRRSRALVITALILIVVFFGITTFASIYTDRLWYQSVGYGQVFSTLIWTKVGLFVVFGALMGVVVGVNMFLAYRFRPLFRPTSPEQTGLDRYRDAVTPIRTWLLVGVSVVIALFAGASAMGEWRTYLLWRNAQSFGTKDAQFEKDIGYYIFHLPWQHYLVDFAMAATVIALLATAVVHYLYGGIRLQVSRDRLSPAAQVQISVLLGVFVLAKAVDYYLDRFDLVNEKHERFTGMNYTADNAVLPAKNILLGIALICAVLFFLNIWRRTWQLPVVGLALLAISSVLLGMIWPAIVQQFQVNPSEADKEAPYIEDNMEATRAAYDLSDVEFEDYNGGEGDLTQGELAAETASVPLVDPQQVRETFEQRQQVRAHYSVANVLDVDRYDIDGEETPLVLGARELDQSRINASDRNWNNLHTVYTHGEGIIAAYADQIPSAVSGDRIVWAEGNDFGQEALSELGDGFEQRIYFGEKSPEYSIVGKASEESNSVELALPGAATDEEETTTYTGEGGVAVGSTFNQLMYALKFGEPNFLLSGRVNDNSQVLYNRKPTERVEKVAPWLTLDSDPYPAVVDGRVLWIVDGYTTTDRFPYSQRESFAEMIDDSLQDDTGLQTLPTDEINYMRSAVKATVDAYDGSVTLYAWDEDDPILKAWMGAFPDTVQPQSEISDELMEHLRYPEDLFKVQRYQLAKYHVTEAGEFYQGNNRWDVPPDPNEGGTFQPPYRMFLNQSGDISGSEVWAMTSVFVPRDKGNLASYISVNSDATSEEFGQMKVLEITDVNAPGPGQVANEMSQDEEVVEALTGLRVANAPPPVFGNLLTLPVDDGLVYIEPVYAVRSGTASSFPILRYVIASYKGDVGIGETLPKALANALGTEITDVPPDEGPPPEQGDPGPDEPNDPQGPDLTVDEQIADLLSRADKAFNDADAAQRANDTAEWARLMEKGRDLISRALALADSRGTEPPGTGG
jgi:uncharacterized membrane protein (UPF0182 family)